MRRRTVAVLVLAAFASGSVVAAVSGGGVQAPPAPPGPHPVQLEPKPKPTPKSKPRPRPLPTVEIAAVGDITLGRTPSLPAGGPGTLFHGVERPLHGDLVLGNLETTLTEQGYARCVAGSAGCFTFRAPPAYARGLRAAGYTILNLANNHAYDFGAAGQAETVAALDRAGLLHTGRPGEIAYLQAGDVRIAVVGFAPYRWAQSLLSIPDAQRLVRRAGRNADVVVATMHAGGEGGGYTHVGRGSESYLGEPRGDVIAFAHAVVDAGADVVIGHGPHVLRGLQWYHGRLIAYSTGNFAGYNNFGLGGNLSLSAIFRVTLRPDGSFVKGRWVPVRLVGPGLPQLDYSKASLHLVSTLSREDFGAHGARFTADGRIRTG